MANLGYDAQIQAIIGQLEQVTEKLIVRIGTNVTAELVVDTPKETGWAAANWVPSVGTADSVPAPRPENLSVDDAASRQKGGLAQLSTYRLSKGRAFITNNVPYIIPLNYGHSRQAPSGFVQRAIKNGIIKLGGTGI